MSVGGMEFKTPFHLWTDLSLYSKSNTFQSATHSKIPHYSIRGNILLYLPASPQCAHRHPQELLCSEGSGGGGYYFVLPLFLP